MPYFASHLEIFEEEEKKFVSLSGSELHETQKLIKYEYIQELLIKHNYNITLR